MEFGKMKRNTSKWSNFCMLLRRAGLSASAGLSCLFSCMLVLFSRFGYNEINIYIQGSRRYVVYKTFWWWYDSVACLTLSFN